MRPPGLVLAIAICLVGGALFGAPAASSQDETAEATAPERPRIYRWIDENGIAHYTTDAARIPSGLSDQVDDYSAAPLASERVEPSAPRRSAAPAGEAWVARDRSGPTRRSGDVWNDGYEEFVAEDRDPEAEARAAIDRSAEIATLRTEIATLEAEIREDEAALKMIISDPESGGPLVTGEQPEFRTIALRLPERLRTLRELRTQRSALENE